MTHTGTGPAGPPPRPAVPSGRRSSAAGRVLRRLTSARLRSRTATVGVAIMVAFILMAVIGPLVAPYDPSATSVAQLQPPSAAHLLGTTQSGQDVLSQLLVGTAPSLELGFLTAAFATVLSVIIGISSGYFRGNSGEALSAVANVFLVIPALPLVIVIVAYLHGRGIISLAIVIALTGWAFGSRQLRAQTLSLRGRDDIIAARAIGEKRWRIMFVEMMPGLLPIIISSFLFTVIFAIVTQAALAFLGLTQISSWNWGTMLYWTQNQQAYTLGAWWWYVPPGLAIALVGMGLGLINFGIDELVNPRLRMGRRRRRHPSATGTAVSASAASAAPPPVAGADSPGGVDGPLGGPGGPTREASTERR